MRCRYVLLACAVLVTVLVALPNEEPVRGCAVAPPHNQPVEIADETAFIIWDAVNKTEHFIRRASFKTQADNFGFLVPTPTEPTLAEADDEAFTTLSKITAPKIVTQSKPASPGCGIGCGAAAPKMAAGVANDVTVLSEKRVAGYDTVVLKADDADALSKWLTEHGYDFDPSLKDWIGHYVKAKWNVTALKVAKPEKDAPNVGTKALRMTFKTEQPFFPYREPDGQAAAKGTPTTGRLLRVFLVSDKRSKGVLGDKDGAWPGKVVWSDRVEPADRKKLLEMAKLPADALPTDWWLTEFEDHSSPRPGTDDVYFMASDDQKPVARPPHVQYVSLGAPQTAVCFLLAGCVCLPLLAWRRRPV